MNYGKIIFVIYRKIIMKYTYILLFLLIILNVNAQEANRYTTPIFNDFNVYKNLTYAQITQEQTKNINENLTLKLDFYEPTNDEAIARPLVILFPDGNYLTAQKQESTMVDWCIQLTKYGYTCACVDYRQGYPSNLTKGIERAMYKGVQDGRAAIRYLKEFERTFKVDTNQIFVGGKFSGADIALHLAFMDLEKERPSSTYQLRGFRDLECLDCSGNNFEQKINIKGVINIEGRVYNPSIMNNNKDTKILNFVLKEQDETRNADKTENLQSIYSTNFIHRFLKKNNIKTTIHDFDGIKSKSISFDLISNFILSNLQNKSSKPIGDEKVCVLSTSTVSISKKEGIGVEWFVNKGTILRSDNQSADIIWNKGIGEAKVQIIETNVNGLKCDISKSLVIQIIAQPIVDFDIEYLSDNSIRIVDNSQYGNLLMIDFGDNEGFHQEELKSNTLFSYRESGKYLITQTVEGRCGVSTQQVPIEINTPLSLMTSNLETFIDEIPENIKKGEDLRISFSKLKEVESISLQVFDTKSELLLDNFYKITEENFRVIFNDFIAGTYFLVFNTNSNVILTKRIRIQ